MNRDGALASRNFCAEVKDLAVGDARIRDRNALNNGMGPMNPQALTGFISGDRHVTAEQMADRVARAATVLGGHGIAPHDQVAIMLRNDLAFIEASYAAQALGA